MLYEILILVIIVMIKAMFSAADTAFIYLNRAEIKQLSKKDKKAEKIKILMEDSNKFFGTIEIGINLCELVASAFVSITILEQFADFLEKMQISSSISIFISAVIITLILAYILLIFGGILPRRIARNNPKKVAYSLISILWIITKINYPFEKLIDISIDFFTKIFKLKQETQEKMTEKQLKMIIKEAKDEGVVENIEKKILLNTLNANDVSVKKIMIPMCNVTCINIDKEITEILDIIKENRYSRMPVYKETSTNIIGIFNIKDIAIEYAEIGIKNKEQIKKLIKQPLFLNEDEKIFSAFKIMQANSQMFAIVVDENYTPLGIVSIENILEKLVGQIFDENDKR